MCTKTEKARWRGVEEGAFPLWGMRDEQRRLQHGYILFEVLLATMIFGLVVVGFAMALNDTASSMLSGQRESRIRLGLQSHLAEIRVQPIVLGKESEKPDQTGVVYEREWRRLELTNQDRVTLNQLFELVVRARWHEQGSDQTEEAHLYLYRPQ